MNHNPVGWFEIYVQDISRARNFYESVFLTKLEHLSHTEPEMLAFPMMSNGYGAPGALVKMAGKDSGGSGIIIYFSCADCAVETARVSDHGGRVHRDKFSIGEYGFISLVLDSEGNMIGLHSMK